MSVPTRRTAVALAVTALAGPLAGCGEARQVAARAQRRPARGDALRIGLLLPENQTARYERFDRPLIERRVADLTGGRARVVYANAKQDAALQNQQIETMLTHRVHVLVLDAVDARAVAGAVRRAKDAGVPVLAYDRLAEGPVAAYTSFDNEEVGRVQGEALLRALGDRARTGRIVMLNGSVTDPNAAVYKRGAHRALDGRVSIGREFDVQEWKPEHAHSHMRSALTALGKDRVVGVYCANDGMAGGVVQALKGAGVSPLPPVTGQDAELAAVQRIVAGEQYMSVYKPYARAARAAADLAVALARGEPVTAPAAVDSATARGVPAVLVPVVALTRDRLADTVLKDGLHSRDEVCTARYAAACDRLDLPG
ncbi:substrate-binding domain-containing protein [Streptomyces sp. LE64]|uniref:substrate-binding domain-containing protein n=1 Tax=Streptomyces sp. LE64 TaxID=3448653 RepID=UPI004040EFE5